MQPAVQGPCPHHPLPSVPDPMPLPVALVVGHFPNDAIFGYRHVIGYEVIITTGFYFCFASFSNSMYQLDCCVYS